MTEPHPQKADQWHRSTVTAASRESLDEKIIRALKEKARPAWSDLDREIL